MNEYEMNNWASYEAGESVRTKGFEIDGSNDPKRGFKGYAPAVARRHRSGFTGVTAQDMPN